MAARRRRGALPLRSSSGARSWPGLSGWRRYCCARRRGSRRCCGDYRRSDSGGCALGLAGRGRGGSHPLGLWRGNRPSAGYRCSAGGMIRRKPECARQPDRQANQQRGSDAPDERRARQPRRVCCDRRGKIAVANRRAHMPRGDAVSRGSEGREQALVGDDVDASRQPGGGTRDQLDAARIEHVDTAVTGSAQAEAQIIADLAAGQRRQAEAVGNALAQLAHLRQRQVPIQFRLTEQHDLQQLGAAGFEIGQQADLFQRFQRHRVRFVDQRNRAPALGVQPNEVLLQRAQHPGGAGLDHVQAKVVGDRAQQFVALQAGNREIDGFDILRQALDQHPAQHGLARADLAADLDDALAVGDRVQQPFQRRAAVRAGKEELGVWRDRERRFGEAEMFQIHLQGFPSIFAPQPSASIRP